MTLALPLQSTPGDAIAGSDVRVAATAVLVTLLLAGAYLAVRLGPSLRDRFGDRAVEAARVVAAGAALVVVGSALATLWSGSTAIERAAAAVSVDRGTLARVTLTAAIGAGAVLATRLSKRVIRRALGARDAVSRHQVEVTHHVVQVGVYTAALLVVLSVWRVDLGGLLVGAGVAGIVIGLAARQTLGSVIAGFVVLFARPFTLGDWVEVDDVEGVVTDVTIVNTELRTFDEEYVVIPNDVVASERVVNRSRRGRLRLEVDVGVDYETDLEAAMEAAEEAMADVDLTLDHPAPRAVCVGFGDSAVLLRLRFYIDDPSARRKWRARTEVVAAVKAAFDDAGVDIPFPQRVVSSREGPVPAGDGTAAGAPEVPDDE